MLQKIMCFILSLLQTASFYCTGWMVGKDKTKIEVNSYKMYNEFEGFGTSLCWWAQRIDTEENAEKLATLLFDDEKGLGLDIVRYDIGGGSKDDKTERVGDIARKTEGFFDYDEKTGECTLNFNRDKNARRVLDKALEHGAKKIVLFANSPHFSLTASGHASGGLTTDFSNLPRENYGKYVKMFLDVADKFVEEGYPIYAISPINEPQWSWGGDWVGQEGCHYTVEETTDLMSLFVKEMKKRNCKYILSGMESGSLTAENDKYIDSYFGNKEIDEYCDTLSGHSYWLDDNKPWKTSFAKRFKKNHKGKKLEMTEWCELPMKLDPHTIDSGLLMARTIADDLTCLNAVSWTSWVAVNGDGVLDFTNDPDVFDTYERYYAYKQFSSFIKPGMVRVELMDFKKNDDLSSVAFKDDEKTVIVLVNSSDNERKMVLGGKYTSETIYTTDATKKVEKTYDGKYEQNLVLASKSINTIILK